MPEMKVDEGQGQQRMSDSQATPSLIGKQNLHREELEVVGNCSVCPNSKYLICFSELR